MRHSILENTGLAVSVLGLGTVKWGRNQGVKYPQTFNIPEDTQLLELLHCARDLGINLLDTAPAYGSSEERLGGLLKNSRYYWVLATKVGEEFINGGSQFNFTPEYAEISLKRSLQRLKTDYLDIVLVHSDGQDVDNIQQFGILDYLAHVKQQGLIRAFGMSTKTVEGGLLAVEKSDVVMVAYNPLHLENQPVIAHAFENHKGILIKKALNSGHIQNFSGADPIEASLNFILQEPGVSSIILGTINPKHLIHNARCVMNTQP